MITILYEYRNKNNNWLYPFGFLGIGFSHTIFTQWIVYFHYPLGSNQDTVGVSFIGTILLISYLFQGLLNPILGYVADKIRHPWGRRRPFLILGSLPLATVYYNLWLRTDFWSSLVLICAYGILFVLVVQPYVALLPAIAKTPALRIRYSLMGGGFSILATGAALIGGPKLLELGSFQLLGICGSIGIVLTVFVPALFMSEDMPVAVKNPIQDKKLTFFMQCKELLQHKTFVFFLLGNGCVVLTMIALTITAPYLCETLLGRDRAYTSILNSCVFLGIVSAVIFTVIWKQKLSYISLLYRLTGFNGLLLLMFSFTGIGLHIPIVAWWLGFICIGFMAFIAMISPTIVISTLSDHDGKNREGLMFGLNGLVINIANALSSQTTTLLLGHQGVGWVLLFTMGTAFLASLTLKIATCFQQTEQK